MADHGGLVHGAYEALISRALADALAGFDGHRDVGRLDAAEAADRLADHLRTAIARTLEAVPSSKRPDGQVELVNDLLAWLSARSDKAGDHLRASLVAAPPEVLRLDARQPGHPRRDRAHRGAPVSHDLHGPRVTAPRSERTLDIGGSGVRECPIVPGGGRSDPEGPWTR